jgi:tetratricopeptide (TPR) repeat protein
MIRTKRTLVAVALLGAGLAAAEEPSSKRLLQGDDAKQAAALTKRIEELWAAAKFAEAVAPAQEELALRRRLQGEDHWEVADASRRVETLRKAARLPAGQQQALAAALPTQAKAEELQAQGKYAQAEPLFRKALTGFEEALGPMHSDTATGYANLAYNFHLQGRSKEAEPLFRKALAISKEVRGATHPDTAAGYNNLATILDAQGRSKEAEPLHRQALAIWEEVLGARHPHTASGYNNLATNFDAQGRFKEAEPLFRKALAVFAAVLGAKHPNTAQCYNNLATNLRDQGRAKEAELLHRQALAIWEEVLGPKHPHTAVSCNNLASILDAQGRSKEAESLRRKSLAICKEVLGAKHPLTAHSCNNLAYNLQLQGRAEEAEPLFRQALAIREEVLGAKHLETAMSYNNLATNLDAQGRAKEAEPLWQKGAESMEAARLRLAVSSLDRARAVQLQPHVGFAACLARLERPAEAWSAAEAGLARGLLDDLAARVALAADAETQRRDGQRAARLDALDRLLVPLLRHDKLDDEQRRRRNELLRERGRLDAEAAEVAADRSRRSVVPLADVQAALATDTALVFWVDYGKTGDHWGCVVRHAGPPAWVRLKGSGAKGEWTPADDKLPRRLRDEMANGEPEAEGLARRLAALRLQPLAPHLAATDTMPAVRRLIVVPVGVMAGIPVEVLTDRYLVSYAPSGSVLARLTKEHRSLREPTLLALGDPSFRLPNAAPPPPPPDHGLYLSLVVPDGNAARHGLRSGDVLLRYDGTRLTTQADLKVAQSGERLPVEVWRDGTTEKVRLDPGKLGVIISADAPAVALRKRRETLQLADARRGGEAFKPLPGTRLEVAAVAALLPAGKATLLLDSDASEQRLDELAAAGKLKDFRLLHFATHGSVDPVSAAHSALELARDRLPGPEEQAKLAAAGKKVLTGRLSVASIAADWQLDADLVTLSACETALGPEGGGEGLLGFAQVLLGKGARGLVLSLWKVDDTATALLMTRFYQNLLGKREGLDKPLPKAEALREAKQWLRTLPRAEVERLAGQLARGAVHATQGSKSGALPPQAATPALPGGDTPFAHPMYWAAFILIGDPE